MTEAVAEPKTEGRKNTVIEDAREETRAAIRDLKAIRCRLLGIGGRIPPSAQETSRGDLEGKMEVETEFHNVIACGIQDRLDPLIDDLETVVEYEPDPVAASSPSIAHLDLSVFSEATQRGLYEVVAAENFGTAKQEPEEDSVPQYTAKQAGLEVVWIWGRWFATWWKLELPETLPEAQRREILLLQESGHRPGTLTYGEV